MAQKIALCVEVMASANRCSSLLGKRKSLVGDSVSNEVEVEATEPMDSVGNVTEIPSDLAPIRVMSSCRSDTEKKFGEEDEESCTVTPKCEEHKIPSVTLCPPAPRKPKSTRNPAIVPCRKSFHFPADSPDLNILFGSDLHRDRQHRKKKLKMRKISSNMREESQS